MVVAATAQIGVVEQGGRTAFFGRRVVALAGEERGDALAIERAEFEGSGRDRFDVGRSPNPHMAFGGGGPHLCLGMHVARLEIDAMFRALLGRYPHLESAGDRELMSSNFIAGVHSMPVRLGAPA